MKIAKEGLEYQKVSDSFFNTPAISEKIIDSTKIQFSLNNQMELQLLNITFPTDLNQSDILLNTKPLELNIDLLENIAESYFYKLIISEENIIKIGDVAIPVMLDYSVVGFGVAQNLRENRLLVFQLFHDGNTLNVSFKNTLLNSRYGYPIKRQIHFYNPFCGITREERIAKRDRLDVEELLNKQLRLIEENIKND